MCYTPAYTFLPRSYQQHTRRSHAQHDQVPPQVVPDEREVKVVLTAHPEVTEAREVTDADSMTRRRVPDQITDLDSPVSVVVQVLQLRKAPPFFVYPSKNTKPSQYSTPVYLHSASFIDLRDILFLEGRPKRNWHASCGALFECSWISVQKYAFCQDPPDAINSYSRLNSQVCSGCWLEDSKFTRVSPYAHA